MRQWTNKHWFRKWIVAWSTPSHYLIQRWHIVNWTIVNKLQWNLSRYIYIYIFILEEAFELIRILAAISCRPQCVRMVYTIYVSWGHINTDSHPKSISNRNLIKYRPLMSSIYWTIRSQRNSCTRKSLGESIYCAILKWGGLSTLLCSPVSPCPRTNMQRLFHSERLHQLSNLKRLISIL